MALETILCLRGRLFVLSEELSSGSVKLFFMSVRICPSVAILVLQSDGSAMSGYIFGLPQYLIRIGWVSMPLC